MATIIQRSFSGGEITPALYARVDISKYATGLRTCRNFFVMRHGGASNRPGTQFVCEVNDSTKNVRLIPFVFNNAQTYVLEFGDQYMRVIKAGVQLTEASQGITGVTQANPAVLTYSGADNYANGDEVYISGVSGMTQLNNRNFKVANVDTGLNTFELQEMDGTNLDTTGYDAYTSGGTIAEVYEIATPYLEADLPEINFVQSADVITLVHPNYAPRELSRTGDTSWTLSVISFEPSIAAPGGLGTSGGPGGSKTFTYAVTSISEETLEESLQSADVTRTPVGDPTAASPITISWSAVTGAQEYNVYKVENGIYGLIGVAGGTSFDDIGQSIDTTETPPISRSLFNASGEYPSAVTYFQQRLTFANSDDEPEKVWASRSGQFKNFTISSPLQDDDAVTFTMAGRQVNEIRHLLDLGRLIVFTTSGEWTIEGDDAGILRPTAINPRQHSYNGSGTLAPIVIASSALYVQARGSIIRDLGFNIQSDGFSGNDLTIFSAHLFDDYTLKDWAYQQIPHSILWAARDDGTLLGLTYVKEQELLAWHRHDFDGGSVENVTVVPEDNEDVLYLVVTREIDGRTTKYIERMATRNIDEVIDNKFMDSHLTYDGRNTGSTTMTLSGGTTWTYTETLTLTASASYFSASDVGNSIHINGTDADGNATVVRCEITAFTSSTVVSVKPHKTVPVPMRAVAFTDWGRAVDELQGLWHLEGKEVSIFADEFVVASPKNDSYDTVTVTDGKITLSDTYVVIHVGLPYVSDLQTLDIDTAQGESIVDKNKLSQHIAVFVEESRGMFAGAKPPSDDTVDPLEGLVEFKVRNAEPYDDPVDLKTEVLEVNIQPEWNSHGRIFIRQIDPVPLSVLAVAPAGKFPFRG